MFYSPAPMGTFRLAAVALAADALVAMLAPAVLVGRLHL